MYLGYAKLLKAGREGQDGGCALNAVNCLDALIVIETGKGTSHSLGLVRNEDIDFFPPLNGNKPFQLLFVRYPDAS